VQTVEPLPGSVRGDNRAVGTALWLGCGFVAFVIARIIPVARRRRWAGELALGLVTALLLGLLATALDFGGWNEPDWRAGLFAAFGALSALGLARAARPRPE
jgi:uncharacterized membrane protein YeaQ/YmgE (transglycosylase-associated protein family)